MTFNYTPSFIQSGLSYEAYLQQVSDTLARPAVDENAAKLRPNMQENLRIMTAFGGAFHLTGNLKKAVEESPETTWLVIAEGWCTDAAFNLPVMATIERAMPSRVKLRIFLRDANLELIDANLTDGGRSIPKLVVLDQDLQELASWGPRPAALHLAMKAWKEEGLAHKQLVLNMREWYTADHTRSMQEELEAMLVSLPVYKD